MAKSTKKNKVKIEPEGQAHIQASFNNIIISITQIMDMLVLALEKLLFIRKKLLSRKMFLKVKLLMP